MKALSLWQPYASLMAMGLKTNETRSWTTNYRGPLAIHAAQKVTPFIDSTLKALIETCLGLSVLDLPRGGIIATVNLIDCRKITIANRPDEPERSYGDYAPGRFMWITENVRPFKKIIPYRGRQGLFNVREALRVCRVCGCSEFNACEGGCSWVEKDLCSACSGESVYGPPPLARIVSAIKMKVDSRLRGNDGGRDLDFDF